ncbi:hypothetical protein vseg_006874 [Gypsophila vaccaria]
MGVLVLTSWLIIIIPVRLVYFICLLGVTIEDVLWFGQELNHNNTVKLSRIVLLVASTVWLWSNLGVGLFGLLICSIAFSIRGTESKQHDDDEKESISRLSEYRGKFWIIFKFVRCLLRYLVGIMWLWTHKELILYLSPFVAVFVCVIVYRVTRFRGLESRLDRTNTVKGKNVVDPQNSMPGWIEKPIFSVLVVSFILYKTINYVPKFFWGRIRGGRIPFEGDNDITIDSTITSSSTNTSSLSLDDNTLLSSLRAIIGQNVNVNGTQTIGSIAIGNRYLHLKINGGRDIIFNININYS